MSDKDLENYHFSSAAGSRGRSSALTAGTAGPQIPPFWQHRKCKNNHQAVGFSCLESPWDTQAIYNMRKTPVPQQSASLKSRRLLKPLKNIYHKVICMLLFSVKYHLYGNFPTTSNQAWQLPSPGVRTAPGLCRQPMVPTSGQGMLVGTMSRDLATPGLSSGCNSTGSAFAAPL